MNILNELTPVFTMPNVAGALLEAAGKSFVILAAAFPLARLCRRSAAATRHFLWTCALASLLALPPAAVLAPRWSSPAWTGALFQSRPAQTAGNGVPALVVAGPAASGVGQQAAGTLSPGSTGPATPATKRFPWRSLVLPVWAAGVFLNLLVFLERHGSLLTIERGARMVADPEVLELRDSIQDELRVRQKVRLLETDEPLMPMTWGCRRPAALLPADTAKWDRERLRLVLRHELAHVRRGDCLTQALAAVVCALYWFNPLAWLAAARMRVERERACDDLVIALGRTRPSDYAAHLVEIARQWRAAPGAALPVAKRSGLEQRLRALLDGANRHGGLTRRTALSVAVGVAACLVALGGCRMPEADRAPASVRQQLIARLQTFSTLKEKQSEQLAAAAGERISLEFKTFFDAAIRGDGQYVTNRYVYYKKNHPQYTTTDAPLLDLRTSYWSPVLEICLAYYDVMADEPEYVREFEEGIIQSIPRGSVYFGGTDPGRGLVTAFCRSQPEGDPFFTLTQNALADGTYLEYLRRMYGGRLYVPTDADSQRAFKDYTDDAGRRLAEHKLKPDEQVTNDHGNILVSGKVAVMAINALIVKTIFDRNPSREFYLEESYPLDWMFPHLEPNGLILKINRPAPPKLSAETIQRDQDYWQARVQQMIGDWLQPETPLQTVIDFAEKTYGRRDLSGFTGDPRFIHDENSQRMFSKLRSAIAGVYAWRAGALDGIPTPGEYLAPAGAERERMIAAADLAFRQAVALCPYSPEAVFRYANFLIAQDRKGDATSLMKMTRLGPHDSPRLPEIAR